MSIDEIKGTKDSIYPPRDAICTCKMCGHEIARDCVKSACICCKETDHSMIMDGIEGFISTTQKHKLDLRN